MCCTQHLKGINKGKILRYLPTFLNSDNIAVYMDIQEEAIPKSVLRDREDALDMLTDQQLIANYRFDWRSILDLADRLQLEHKTCCRFGQLDHRQLLIALRFYATGSFQSVLVDKFHVNRATVCRVGHCVSSARGQKRWGFPPSKKRMQLLPTYLRHQIAS